MAWDGTTERRAAPVHGQEEILAKLDALSMDMKQVLHFITGNSSPSTGAIVRLDRLEQDQQSRQRHQGFLWAAISSLALKALWDTVMKR